MDQVIVSVGMDKGYNALIQTVVSPVLNLCRAPESLWVQGLLLSFIQRLFSLSCCIFSQTNYTYTWPENYFFWLRLFSSKFHSSNSKINGQKSEKYKLSSLFGFMAVAHARSSHLKLSKILGLVLRKHDKPFNGVFQL